MLTRRVAIGLIVGLLVFGVWAAAETNVPETVEAYIGGMLAIGVSGEIYGLDPRTSENCYEKYIIDEVFEELIMFNPEDQEPSPYIAKRES